MSARYHAPAVAYVFERPVWAAGVLLLIGAGLLAVLLAWCLQARGNGLQLLLTLSALMLAVVLLCAQWRNWPKGRLLWNGGHWSLEAKNLSTAQSLPVRLGVGLDGGHWLWLSVSDVVVLGAKGGRRRVLWIFLSQRHSPEQWGDLRRAVYSSIVPLAEQG